MSDIGPGDWVQAVHCAIDESLTVGAIYRVADLDSRSAECRDCGSDGAGGLFIEGKAASPGLYGGFLSWGSYCPCRFRKWPPPADASLLSEDVDTDVKEPV